MNSATSSCEGPPKMGPFFRDGRKPPTDASRRPLGDDAAAPDDDEGWKRLFRTLSHEIDNSPAPILSLARTGRALLDRPDAPERIALLLDTIANRAEHLQSFLFGYLQYARLPAPQPRPTSWTTLLERLAALLPFRPEVTPVDLVTAVDAAQIEQALINLVKNACEAGGAPDAIEVVVEAHAAGARVRVRDRGPGMPPELLAIAMRPFVSTRAGGTGLGLTLAREIAEAHGGSLCLVNRDGGGLDVTLTLPAGDAGWSPARRDA